MAVAVLGAFAGSAVAADVTLYGVVDTGLRYTHVNPADGATSNKFEMKSGQQAGSRWGLKGAEEIGDGLKVGFVLESGFNSDDGSSSVNGTIFNREASLYVQGGFGKVAFGRIGSINQGTSSWGKVGMISAFGTSYGDYTLNLSNVIHAGAIYDNTIAYETPSFAGLKVYAQYSMGSTKAASASLKADGTVTKTEAQVENESTTDRYYAIGATYNNGPFAAYFAVDQINYKSYTPSTGTGIDTDDSLTVTLGGSYNFDVAKVYLGVQYFDEVSGKTVIGDSSSIGKSKGYAVTLSADAPVAGGVAFGGVAYYDASEADSVATGKEFDLTRYVASVGYKYNLSKRTNVYGVVSYEKDEKEVSNVKSKPSAAVVGFGLRHNF